MLNFSLCYLHYFNQLISKSQWLNIPVASGSVNSWCLAYLNPPLSFLTGTCFLPLAVYFYTSCSSTHCIHHCQLYVGNPTNSFFHTRCVIKSMTFYMKLSSINLSCRIECSVSCTRRKCMKMLLLLFMKTGEN